MPLLHSHHSGRSYNRGLRGGCWMGCGIQRERVSAVEGSLEPPPQLLASTVSRRLPVPIPLERGSGELDVCRRRLLTKARGL